MNRYREATEADYIRVQGIMPEVQVKDGLYYILHQDMVVRTHINPVDRGNVLLSNCDGEVISFCTGLLRKFEGDPCQTRSRIVGGEEYGIKH